MIVEQLSMAAVGDLGGMTAVPRQDLAQAHGFTPRGQTQPQLIVLDNRE
jgi:hypothetical protein